MGEPSDHHVTIFVSGEAADHLEPLRRRWDPGMADQIAPHVTVAYPREAPNLDLLRARLSVAAGRIPPFPLQLGPVTAHEGSPTRGIYHEVRDLVGLVGWLREFLLAPPFTALGLRPHATICHPRTSKAARQAWKELAGDDPAIEFRVGALHLTAHDGTRWVTTDTFELGGALLPLPPELA